MRWASTGPTPGSASSWSRVAVLRLTTVLDAVPGLARVVAPGGFVGSGGAGRPTTICSPSVTWRARLRVVRSTPGSGPPARASTSATREPVDARTRPGRRTLPATYTTRSGWPVELAAPGDWLVPGGWLVPEGWLVADSWLGSGDGLAPGD